jgi:hypothetical protein
VFLPHKKKGYVTPLHGCISFFSLLLLFVLTWLVGPGTEKKEEVKEALAFKHQEVEAKAREIQEGSVVFGG